MLDENKVWPVAIKSKTIIIVIAVSDCFYFKKCKEEKHRSLWSL